MLASQIFISHSAKDNEISDFFIRKFDDTDVKPVLMDYEKWSRNDRPNWMWIKDEIQKSSALFLILTKNIVKNEYTQNWVAFEIGVAATSNLIHQYPFLFLESRILIFQYPTLIIILISPCQIQGIYSQEMYLLLCLTQCFIA
jgi:hypothetical protein